MTKYKCVKFIFPGSLSQNQEDVMISGVQFIRDQAIINMRRSEGNMLSKLAEKLTPENFRAASQILKERIRLLLERLENDAEDVPNPLMFLEKNDGNAYLFGIDHEAFSLLSFKQKVFFIDIKLDYAEKVIHKLKTNFREEIAIKMGIKPSEVQVEEYEAEK